MERDLIAKAREMIAEIKDPEYSTFFPPLVQRASDAIAALLAHIEAQAADLAEAKRMVAVLSRDAEARRIERDEARAERDTQAQREAEKDRRIAVLEGGLVNAGICASIRERAEAIARAALAAAPAPIQPAPQPDADEREAMVRLLQIITRNGSLDDGRTLHEVIADALIASGLRLPSDNGDMK